ncbi:unnamed protein product [Musa acuminata subsp. malaccensis]|nr:unnamed protein product [Musa acuminata subsp. malaccensis]
MVLLLVQFGMVELQLDLWLHGIYMMPQEAMHMMLLKDLVSVLQEFSL